MTREEREDAINCFKNKLENEVFGAKYNKLALEALEQEPCDDCISRDSAIKALDYDIKCFEFKPGVSKHMDDIAKLLNTIYETQVNNIKDLPSATPQEPRWIPVNERLPEDHKDVLAYLSSDRISICRYNSHRLPFSNNPIGWGYLPDTGFIDFEKENVIAWMPLPKEYKAESEDK